MTKHRRINLRVTQEELDLLRELARDANMTLSDYLMLEVREPARIEPAESAA